MMFIALVIAIGSTLVGPITSKKKVRAFHSTRTTLVPTQYEILEQKEEAFQREKIRHEKQIKKEAAIAAERARALRIQAEKKKKAAREAAKRRAAERIRSNPVRDTRGDVRGDNGYRRLMTLTAYTAGYESTQKKKGEAGYGITASGTRVTEGRTLACGPSIPFGTRITIPSLGISGICEDRGGAISDSHIDVFIEDLSRARAFGKKTVEVIVHR